ncbi:hypothetical protein [Burkholderia arboris]|uniref:hypothetical protein n=1 Tax=Burkholderia arboris TaxID=488730 RepID=UPI001582F652|nr:hypothetical protein [Burkholderia arboris]
MILPTISFSLPFASAMRPLIWSLFIILFLDMDRLFHRCEILNHRSVVPGALARDNQDAGIQVERIRDGSRYDAVREPAPPREQVYAGGSRVDRYEGWLSVFTCLVRFRTAFTFASV